MKYICSGPGVNAIIGHTYNQIRNQLIKVVLCTIFKGWAVTGIYFKRVSGVSYAMTNDK